MLRSKWSVFLASLMLPPVGFVLLWLRSGVRTWVKIICSTVLVAWSVVYLMLFFGLRFPLDGSGMRPIPTFGSPESHYSRLEQSRAGQSAPPVVEASATPVTPPEEKPASPFWTDFRGPHRDGRYDQTPIRTEWPEKGLPLLWRQPIGGGYASFVKIGRAHV